MNDSPYCTYTDTKSRSTYAAIERGMRQTAIAATSNIVRGSGTNHDTRIFHEQCPIYPLTVFGNLVFCALLIV